MNRKMVFYLFGRILQVEALLLLLPALTSLVYGETRVLLTFLSVAGGSALFGTLVALLCRTKNKVIYAKEGFAIVALAWVGMSVVGALPFVISGDIPNNFDAFFEIVSGFTTTGASVLPNVERLSHGALFWRSFSHWVGGMGVLVFVMAIVRNMSDRSIHIMRAEMPGPIVGKLVPRASDTAKILYLIYIVLTVIQIIMLCAGGMPFFDSLIHSFGTAGTGGFGIKSNSIAGYSNYSQIVITVFMLIFGVNFNLYYLLLIRRFRSVLKSTELWAYLGMVAVSIVVITFNILPIYDNFNDSLRHASFQVSSIITTTGYTTTDFNVWPHLSKGILLLLMCLGGCAGSTAGGLKVSRAVILFKLILREIKKMLHPRAVTSVKFEGKAVEDGTLSSVATYFAVYAFCIFAAFLVICFEPFGFESNVTAVLTTFNNVGPGFATVGPMGGFGEYTAFSKIVFSFAMLFGRLEIFPMIIALSPSTWMKK